MNFLKWLHVTAVALLLLLLLIIILIVSGRFDPHPFGSLVDEQVLQPITVPTGGQQVHLLQRPLPQPPYSIHLAAALQSGERDSGYGLLLGSLAHQFGVAVSPLGTVSVWEDPAQSLVHLPWQTWPHVQQGNNVNEIWLDVMTDEVTVRINREVLWVGQTGELDGAVTLWVESWGETAVVDFQALQLFTIP